MPGLIDVAPAGMTVTHSQLRSQMATFRMQARYGLQVTVQVRGNYLVLDKARYQHGAAAVQKVLKEANARLARDLQVAVVKAFEEGRLPNRRAVSTGRLHRALDSEKNVLIRPWGIGVGVPGYLNRSVAKYWRQIDEGTTVHVERHHLFRGTFGETATGSYASGASGRWMIPGPAFSAPGAGKHNGKFLPAGRTHPLSNVQRALQGTDQKSVMGGFYISKPIDEQDYFRRGWRAVNAPERARQNLLDAIEVVLGHDSIELGKQLPTLDDVANWL